MLGIDLRPGKGGPKSGGEQGGFFWHVYVGAVKAATDAGLINLRSR